MSIFPLKLCNFYKWQIYENLSKIEIYIHDGKLGCSSIDVCIFQICIEIKYNLPDSVLLCVQQSNLFSIVILQGPDFTWKKGLRYKYIIDCTFAHSCRLPEWIILASRYSNSINHFDTFNLFLKTNLKILLWISISYDLLDVMTWSEMLDPENI